MKKQYTPPKITSDRIDDQVLLHCLLESELDGQCQQDLEFHLQTYP